MAIPEGWADPASVAEVTAILDAVQRSGGVGALTDLLGRMPGVTRVPATPRGLFRAAAPERLWLGPEDAVALGSPPVHEQVVGGVVLHRTALAPGTAPAVLAALLVRLVDTGAAHEDASAVLTAARDTAAH